VLTTTPHFKGEGDCISFHLKILMGRRGEKKKEKKKIHLRIEANKQAFNKSGLFYGLMFLMTVI